MRSDLWTLGAKLAVSFIFWLVVIGGTIAFLNVGDIRDDDRRAALTDVGIRVPGLLSSKHKRAELHDVRRCGRGRQAIVRFKPVNSKSRAVCVSEGLPPTYDRYFSDRPMPDAAVDVTYDPNDASHFFVHSPGGPIPRRNLDGLWRLWLEQTTIMLAICWTGTAIFLFKRRSAPLPSADR